MIEGSEALHAVRRPLAEASHAPGFLYASPEVYRREVERLFIRDWRYVARVEELPHPGDYMTLRIAGESLVIARDQAGALHAYYNMCVHRGVEVAQGWGNAKAFKCPYHGWAYDLAGWFTGVAYMKETDGFEVGVTRRLCD
jgi:phenylpropionate dioxygenase-like ring-hydroxylating dioxygenase large terminal subunit